MMTNQKRPVINVIQLPHAMGLNLPRYETDGSAGMDLPAAVTDPVFLEPGKRILIPTGLIFEIPDGFEVQIRPRSGLAFKHGVTCLNTPGTIDSDYRGEVSVLLINHGTEIFEVTRGMRIAQMIAAPVIQAKLELHELAGKTDRGTGGFGSTGL
ncbi:MAG: dUTP diphosphatase [Salaquimonas sp.]